MEEDSGRDLTKEARERERACLLQPFDHWAGPRLDRIAKDRGNMIGSEREAAPWAAVRHYAHLAQHGPSVVASRIIRGRKRSSF